MSYEKLKEQIKEIAEISASVPEAFRERCFDVLLNHALAGTESKPATPVDTGSTDTQHVNNSNNFEVPSNVKAFMRRRDVTREQIDELVMLEGDDFHFIKEPTHKNAQKGQNEWALLLALKTGILENSLKADPEGVRSLVQEKGFYNATNFSANFGKPKYKSNFKEQLKPQGSAQQLSQDGEKALAILIGELTAN